MTIQFNCPKCGSLIAFADKHIGKMVKCINCGQRLIIPEKSGQTPELIKPKEKPESPLPGFYHAVFVDSWKIFLHRKNLPAFVFVAAAICFKFYSAGACCLGYFAYFAAWGYLFGFYLKLIRETAAGDDEMPEIETGTSVTFFWYMLKPILVFVFSIFLVMLPLIVALAFFTDKELAMEDVTQNTALQILLIGGLFFFPVTILTAAVIEDMPELLRLDHLIMPVIRAFVPYTVTAALLLAACYIESHTNQYEPMTRMLSLSNLGNLAVNLILQVVAIIAMRSIGLFYRHYACYFAD